MMCIYYTGGYFKLAALCSKSHTLLSGNRDIYFIGLAISLNIEIYIVMILIFILFYCPYTNDQGDVVKQQKF